ncbi:MAG: hypothetical protein JXN62_12215 [Bacteroidales bacterium]|nr:hypothetical protein [Bacteroidales bacterium]
MKRMLFLILITLISEILIAQDFESLRYQTIVRNSAGDVIASRTVSFRLTVLMGELPGITVYSENQQSETDKDGMVTLLIGEGTDKTGDLNTIPWETDEFFLKVEVDVNGGNDYIETGTSQLLIVPSSLPAKRSKKSSLIIEEEELIIIRKFIGTYLDFRHTGPEAYGGPNIIWIKTSMEKIYGKISAYGKNCDFSPGDNLYLKRTFYSPGGISGYWIYEIENDSSVSYRATDLQHDKKVFIETWF